MLRPARGIQRELLGQLQHLAANLLEHGLVGAIVQRLGDPLADLSHLGFLHAARGQRWRTDANAAGLHRRIGIERNGVLVHRDAGIVQRVLGFAAQHALGEHIDQHQVRVGAAGDDAEAFVGQCLRQNLGVGHDLSRVVLEAGLKGFLEAHSFRRDDVHQRSALHSWEDDLVDCGRMFLLGEDHSGARPAQCLVRGGGDNMAVWYGRWMHATGNQSGEVRHVDQVERADFVGNLAHAGEVDDARIGAPATDDELRTLVLGESSRLHRSRWSRFLLVTPYGTILYVLPEKFSGWPCVRCPPCARFRPRTVSPGAMSAA